MSHPSFFPLHSVLSDNEEINFPGDEELAQTYTYDPENVDLTADDSDDDITYERSSTPTEETDNVDDVHIDTLRENKEKIVSLQRFGKYSNDMSNRSLNAILQKETNNDIKRVYQD